jgi:hypothetical protein
MITSAINYTNLRFPFGYMSVMYTLLIAWGLEVDSSDIL